MTRISLQGNKNEEKVGEKPEKKEKKIKEMSESRVKKFHKLFSMQVSADEKLINYFSCALVAEILLQGHLYVSENYFSFYSNVFGYVTKLVIPITTVTAITKEKTAKFFPNAIALQLNEGKHVFGSFMSREAAYQLMQSIHRKNEVSTELIEEIEEVEVDEIDAAQAQDVEVSSADSSSISGSESPIQCKTPNIIGDVIEEEQPPTLKIPLERPLPQEAIQATPVARNSAKRSSDFKFLFVGICLTILLAFFSGLLLLKINAIEKRTQPISFIDDAESILNRNVLIVRNVRKKLEDLQELLLQNSFDKTALGDKQEL